MGEPMTPKEKVLAAVAAVGLGGVLIAGSMIGPKADVPASRAVDAGETRTVECATLNLVDCGGGVCASPCP